jgi:hypothetical protein
MVDVISYRGWFCYLHGSRRVFKAVGHQQYQVSGTKKRSAYRKALAIKRRILNA